MPFAPLRVYKFGGTSVATPQALTRSLMHAQAARTAGARVVVVLSAQRGITDLLLAWAASQQQPDALRRRAITPLLDDLTARHAELLAAAEQMDESVRARWAAALEVVRTDAARLAALAPHGAPDALVIHGERLLLLLAQTLARPLGLTGSRVDGTDVIVVDETNPTRWIDAAATRTLARATVLDALARDGVVFVPGYAGRTRTGTPVTLGRGGSDLTASILAAALGAESVWLGKDVPALLTADPRLVPTARAIAQCSPEEAQELAFWGSTVLHPRTLIPLTLATPRIPLAIFDAQQAPSATPGTWIGTPPSGAAMTAPDAPPLLTGLSAIRPATLVTLQGKGLLGVPGIAARFCATIASVEGSIHLLTQGASEGHVCAVVPAAETDAIAAALTAAFAPDQRAGLVEAVLIERDLGIVTVVGEGLRARPGTAAAVTRAVADAGVNIRAIAQGSSERAISLVVRADAVPAATRALHQLLEAGPSSPSLAGATRPVVRLGLLGLGQIAQGLLARLATLEQEQTGLAAHTEVRIAWVATRAGRRVAPPRGWTIGEVVAHLAAARDLPVLEGRTEQGADWPATLFGDDLAVVDVASSDTATVLTQALAAGARVVTANKGPLADTAVAAAPLWAGHAQGRLRLEATVGAGIPLIATLTRLRESGDTVSAMELHASGTLAFLTAQLSDRVAFHTALTEAMEAAFTEPDPRLDLSGQDVARKAVILSRLAWGDASPLRAVSEVELTPLWADPAAAQDLAATGGLEGLLARARAADPAVAARYALQGPEGRWAYAATLTPTGGRVGPLWCEPSHPYASWRGPANLLRLTTHPSFGAETPLLLGGPGAGVASTVSGLIQDLTALTGAPGRR